MPHADRAVPLRLIPRTGPPRAFAQTSTAAHGNAPFILVRARPGWVRLASNGQVTAVLAGRCIYGICS